MLSKCCSKYASKSGRPSTGHRSILIPVPKKGNIKEYSKYWTIALISHTSKVMLKILQDRLQQYINRELPRCSSWIEKRRRNQRSNFQHPLDHRKSKRVPEKHLLLPYWLRQSLWLCGSWQTGKFLKRPEYQTTWPDFWEICMQVRKQQLELDMGQQTGSK